MYTYIYIYIHTELLDGNQGHQEETHRPTHRFRRLFLDLLSMGWRGCASAVGAIKLPPSCSRVGVCRRCSNYIFVLNLTPGFNGLGKDNYKMRWEAFKFWDLVRLVWETLRYLYVLVCNNGLQLIDTAEDIASYGTRLFSVVYVWIMAISFPE